MLSRSVTGAFAVATLFALHAIAFAADPKIGNAKSTRNQVEGVVGGQTERLSTGSDVFTNETVRTGAAAVADLVFIDNTNLSVGPTSEVRLDKFVYDPTGSSGSVVIQATRGAFRFVTGSQDKRVYQIKTPFGSLGVRGTIVEMVLKPCTPGVPHNQCGVTLKLVEGSATFTTTSGQTVDLSQANTVVTINGDGAVTQTSQVGTILNFAATGSTTTTAGIGGAGGGGGTVGSLGPNGGTNVGSTGTATSLAATNTASGLGNLTSSVGVSGLSNPTSP
jgi:FecR protein